MNRDETQAVLGIVEALSKMEGQPDLSFDAMREVADQLVGAKLFTLMAFDSSCREASRIHTNMPDAYPLFGKKPLPEGKWTETVVDAQEIFVANDIQGIAKVFPDHEKILSLGCESVINVPVVAVDELLGTINCLDRAGAYTEEKIEAARNLVPAGAACFLLHRKFAAEGGS